MEGAMEIPYGKTRTYLVQVLGNVKAIRAVATAMENPCGSLFFVTELSELMVR
jgi:O6-methylguanine-DNA--protein-cysteine methyltransferase